MWNARVYLPYHKGAWSVMFVSFRFVISQPVMFGQIFFIVLFFSCACFLTSVRWLTFFPLCKHDRFLLRGIEHLSSCMEPNNMVLLWIFGQQVAYLQSYSCEDPYYRWIKKFMVSIIMLCIMSTFTVQLVLAIHWYHCFVFQPYDMCLSRGEFSPT